MKHITKMLSLLMVLAIGFGLVACSKDAPSSSQVVEAPSSQVELPPEEEAPSFDPTTARFLTGLEKGDDYPAGQRVAAVMVGNDRGAWPHWGLSDASLLVEAIVDSWYITRMVAVYEDYTTMPDVRPVRSARDQLYQMVAPLYPLFVHDGPSDRNQPVYQKMREIDAEGFDLYLNGHGYATARTDKFSGTYNEYTNGDRIANAVQQMGIDDQRQYNSPMFDFVPYTEPKRVPGEGTATDVVLKHTASNLTGYTWNGSQYELSMNNGGQMVKLTDGNNGETVAFDNVIILFTEVSQYSASVLLKFEYTSGTGYYLSEGAFEPFYWEKGNVGSMVRLMNLYDHDESFQINPGTIYIAVADVNQQEEFDANLRAGSTALGDIPDASGEVED